MCGRGPFREYCDMNKICTLFHPVCNEISSYTCPTDNVLHLSTGKCLVQDSSNCSGGALMPNFIPHKYEKYEIIYQNRVSLYRKIECDNTVRLKIKVQSNVIIMFRNSQVYNFKIYFYWITPTMRSCSSLLLNFHSYLYYSTIT